MVEENTKKYYYYKKKRGRHKKPGPKKKKKIRGRRWQEPWEYKIVICNSRKQDKYIGKFRNLSDVENVKKELLEQNDNILFPKKYINNQRKDKKIFDSISEYVVLKRIPDETNVSTNQLRNEYGKFVEISTNSDKWLVYDRFPYLSEETFWVYGYSPKTDRKNIEWIINNLIDFYCCDKYSIIQVFIYNNKIIFKYDTNDIEFVICKNISDSIRMYNLLKDKYKKQKNVLFSGMATKKTEKTKYIVDLIEAKTGWDRNKIYRKTTRA